MRTLAGLVCEMGTLRTDDKPGTTELADRAADVYDAWRNRHRAVWQWFWHLITFRFVRPTPDTDDWRDTNARVRFLGVWDTVDAVGFPVPGISRFWNRVVYRFKFPDYELNRKVGSARHALAIDDQRASFHPLLWDEAPGHPDLSQVWFAGVHTNVGGGYPKQGMSLVTLDWMMDCTERLGGDRLHYDYTLRERYRSGAHVHDSLGNPRRGAGVFYRLKPRDVAKTCGDSHAPVRVHRSVLERAKRGTDGYAPHNLPDSFELVSSGDPSQNERARLTLDDDSTPSFDGPKAWFRVRRWTQYAFYAGMLIVLVRAWLTPTSGQEGARLPTLDAAIAWVLAAPGRLFDAVADRLTPLSELPTRFVAWIDGLADAALELAAGMLPVASEWVLERIATPLQNDGRLALLAFAIPIAAGLIGSWAKGQGAARASAVWGEIDVESSRPEPAPGAPTA